MKSLENAFVNIIGQYDLDTETIKQIFEKAMDTVEKIKKSKLICSKCKEIDHIANITLYQTHFYVQPYGCSSGDYWLDGECQFVCNHCDTTNRLLAEKTKQNIAQYKKYFKKVINTYEQKPTKWINNFSEIQ